MNNFLNSMLFCGVVMIVQGLLDYLFSYLIWGYADSYLIRLNPVNLRQKSRVTVSHVCTRKGADCFLLILISGLTGAQANG